MFGKNTEKNLLAWALYQEDNEQYAEAMKTYRELAIAYPDSVQPQLGIARVEEATGAVSSDSTAEFSCRTSAECRSAAAVDATAYVGRELAGMSENLRNRLQSCSHGPECSV